MAEKPSAPESLDAKVADTMAARRNGYFMTGDVLQQFAPAMAMTTVALSSCRSLQDPSRRADSKMESAKVRGAGFECGEGQASCCSLFYMYSVGVHEPTE